MTKPHGGLTTVLLAVTLLMAIALTGAAQTGAAQSGAAQTPAPAKKSAGGEVNFKKLVERYYAAWNAGNSDAPAKFYAKDAGLVFYDIAPMKYNGWSEYHDGVEKNFFATVTTAKLVPNLKDLKVTRRGNVAWTTLTFHITGTLKTGGAMEVDARHTAIWELRGSRWLIVHEHVSAPLGQ